MKFNVKTLKIFGRSSSKIIKFNLIFVLVFLNIWDFILSRQVLNAMTLGIVMLAVPTVLWSLNSFKASMGATLYSIFLSSMLAVFFAEGYEAGTGWFLKLSFWLPYLLVAILNAVWGLKIYAKYKTHLKGEKNASARLV